MIIYYTDRFTGGREESHRLLEKALAVFTGDPAKAAELTGAMKKGEHGKPYMEGFSCFSISHTENVWAVLICGRECGLDIQFGKKCDTAAISRRIFAPEDAAMVCGGDPSDEAERFFRIWTRREALAKALGGTVYDTSLPPVSADTVTADGRTFSIAETAFPAVDGPPAAKLYASVCAEGGSAADAGEIEFIYI